MIKPNYTIGNLINNFNEIIEINGHLVRCRGLSFSEIVDYSHSEIKPIKITDEILINFGFTIDDDCAWISTTEEPNQNHESYYQKGQFVIYRDTDKDGLYKNWCLGIGDYRNELYAKIEFVHELQNAFSLIGKELKRRK